MSRKPLKRALASNWYMERPNYRSFMLRELTSVPLVIYLCVLIGWLISIAQGPEEFAAMVHAMQSPLMLVFHCVALAAALYHTITWFNLTPKAMPLQLGEHKVPGPIVAIVMGYGPWLTVSLVLAVLVLFFAGGDHAAAEHGGIGHH